MKRWLSGLLAALLLFSLAGCGLSEAPPAADAPVQPEDVAILPVEEDPEIPESPPPDAPETPEDPVSPPEEPPEHAVDPDADLPDGPVSTEANSDVEECWVEEDGSYTTKEDVACYIHFFGHLPDNFITKKEAQNLGWPGGSLEPYAPGMCIGGSRFGNYEGLLPEAKGRQYTECDIDTLGAKSRGAKRIVFSNDGLIYYTGDHYESFELLYGDETDG